MDPENYAFDLLTGILVSMRGEGPSFVHDKRKLNEFFYERRKKYEDLLGVLPFYNTSSGHSCPALVDYAVSSLKSAGCLEWINNPGAGASPTVYTFISRRFGEEVIKRTFQNRSRLEDLAKEFESEFSPVSRKA